MNEEILEKMLNEEITCNYSTIEDMNADFFDYEMKKLKVQRGYFILVKYLREMNKSQLKKLFYHLGLKQVMNISTVSTNLFVDSLKNNDYCKKNSKWKIIV